MTLPSSVSHYRDLVKSSYNEHINPHFTDDIYYARCGAHLDLSLDNDARYFAHSGFEHQIQKTTMPDSLNRVLIVEDEDDIREITRHLLEVLGGFTVKECVNGQQALDNLDSFKPDLILCDVMMPVMDGITTLEKLKEMPHMDSVPFVFMSARVQKHEVESYLEMGAAAVINKPFDPTTLSDRLREIWAGMENSTAHDANHNK